MGKEKPVMEGWLLKKKRKKMQGFAKRYFFLSPDGVLSYATQPDHRIRDSVFINLSSIATSKSNREIHVDSGDLVMHIKAQSDKDFDKWTEALKKVVQSGGGGGGTKEGWAGGQKKRRKRTAIVAGDGDDARTVDLSKMYHAIAKMGTPLDEIDGVLEALRNDPAFNESDTGGGGGGGPKATVKKLLNKTKKHDKGDKERSPSSVSEKSGSNTAVSDSNVPDHHTTIKQLANALAALKTEHKNLVSSINAAGAGFPTDSEEGGVGGAGGLGPSPHTYASRRAVGLDGDDTTPTATDGEEDGSDDGTFQDAESGGGDGAVFVDLDELKGEDEKSSGGKKGRSVSDALSLGAIGRKGSSGGKSNGGEDADDEDSDDDDDDDEHLKQAEQDGIKEDKVKRREQLPHGVAGDEFSMFSMLKKNVGKDLSQVSFPVSFNEPLSALQKVAEECEYTDLLRKAHATKDPIEKIVFVTAFAVSGFSSTKYRSSRKPFNPLLGETFECIREDKNLQFISEKVSHHPPIMAAYAQGNGWKLHVVSAARQKFWGKSLELIPEGSNKLEFDDGSIYTWEKPSSFVRNIMSGTKYLEHVGKMTVKAEKSGEKVELEFKQGSSWGGADSRNKVEGKVLDSSGKDAGKLVGKWDEHLSRDMGSDHFQQVLKVAEFPKDAPKYYGFTKFAIELNEITDDIKDKLCPTDSRNRPDQRAFEEGKVDEAEEGKKKLEEKQRARRKQWNEEGKKPSPPQWFEEKGKEWIYKGGYFEKRDEEKPEWNDLDIF